MVDSQTASLGFNSDCFTAVAGDRQRFDASSKKAIRMGATSNRQTQNGSQPTKHSQRFLGQDFGNHDVQYEHKRKIVGRRRSAGCASGQRHHQSPLQESMGAATGRCLGRRACVGLSPLRFHRKPSRRFFLFQRCEALGVSSKRLSVTWAVGHRYVFVVVAHWSQTSEEEQAVKTNNCTQLKSENAKAAQTNIL